MTSPLWPRRLGGSAALVCACVLLTACGGSAPRPVSASTRPSATSATSTTSTTSGIPASLLAGLRTVGAGERFHPPVTGPVLGGCRPTLGRRIAAHVELFAENHVVLIAGGVGTRPPRIVDDARVVRARCFGAVVTLDPTGTVYARAGVAATVGELFRSWGQPLSADRLASFTAPAGTGVAVYVDGRRLRTSPGAVPITRHAEIVLEVGPHVPPHRSFTFPPSPAAAMP